MEYFVNFDCCFFFGLNVKFMFSYVSVNKFYQNVITRESSLLMCAMTMRGFCRIALRFTVYAVVGGPCLLLAARTWTRNPPGKQLQLFQMREFQTLVKADKNKCQIEYLRTRFRTVIRPTVTVLVFRRIQADSALELY
jgi:hypothetical protein